MWHVYYRRQRAGERAASLDSEIVALHPYLWMKQRNHEEEGDHFQVLSFQRLGANDVVAAQQAGLTSSWKWA